jgi:hypothetical protein
VFYNRRLRAAITRFSVRMKHDDRKQQAALALSLTAPTISKLVGGYSSNPPRLPSSSDLLPYINAWRVMGAIYLFAGIVMIALYKKPTEQQMTEAGAVEFVD